MKFFPRTFSVLAISLLALTGCATNDSESENKAQSATEQSATPSASVADGDQASGSASSSPAEKTEESKTLYDGTTKIFDNKRYVALYGVPQSSALGALGEQDAAASVDRVKKLAAEYQPFADETVQPAFEIITTVASSVPGDDGDYSDESSPEQLLPLIEEAEKNGVYVVLDFQPGSSDFLSQIKAYEELLKRPNVGVGFDPEWRLAPGQLPLQQIGTVDAAEVNESLNYLAELVHENELPQKMIIMHQFTLSMITNRDQLDVSHKELALTLHADGHGSPDLKIDTYNTLLQGLQEEIKPSWKNFYDEDLPMLTPQQTYSLDDKPWVVTYQ